MVKPLEVYKFLSNLVFTKSAVFSVRTRVQSEANIMDIGLLLGTGVKKTGDLLASLPFYRF
jgi:hypothetical protein